MIKHRKFRLKAGVVCAALLLGGIGAAQAGDYSKLYFFGDSITDSGVFAGQRFTTKPGTVWAENLGARYGKPVRPVFSANLANPAELVFSLDASGNNFAVGAAQINSPPAGKPAATALPSVKMQVDAFLLRGAVDAHALYALWAGGNDIFAQFSSGAAGPWTSAQANLVTAANDLTAQVDRLQAAGARQMIVIGAMNMTQSPSGLAMSASDSAQLGSLMAAFNAQLIANLAGKNLLYFDMLKLNEQIIADPLAYGFTDTTTPACPGSPPNALSCKLPAAGHLYADDRHPSTLYHKVISDRIYSSLEASRAALLSQVPTGR